MARSRTVAVLGLLALAGCELQEVSIVDVEDVVVAEVYVQVGEEGVSENRVLAFLHKTVGGGQTGFAEVPGARIEIMLEDRSVLELGPTSIETCAVTLPADGRGSCYWASPAALTGLIGPGDALELTITLPDGGVLRSATVVPGAFELDGLGGGDTCVLPAETPLEVRWTPAEGTWAYVNEALLLGLREALEPRGIVVEDDPFVLLGLSISAADTSIVFPGEFGIFDRFELDQAVATTLQEGMPAATGALVVISAADRNYVNWARGGNFNPSGLVRVPSVRGDGTGVFAATVSRRFDVVVNPGPDGGDYPFQACPTG